jgi:hypothetical protein
MSKKEILKVTRYLGRLGYQARLKKLGIERIRQIARANGRQFGGRPRLPVLKLTPAGRRTREYRERVKAQRAEARKEGE